MILRSPQLLESIDNPVVLMKEQCVHGSLSWLHDSSCVPTGEIVRCRVWFGIVLRSLGASEAALISTWQGLVVPAVFLGLQPCTWDGRRFTIISISNFDGFPEAKRCLFVRAIDGTAVNEGCNSVYLLSWLSFFGAEDVRPEKDKRIGFVSLV